MENKIVMYISSADVQRTLVDKGNPFQTHNGVYLWELSKLIENGYSPNEFVISHIVAGMSTRDPVELQHACFEKPITCVDLYELHLSRIPKESYYARH